jgi:hypothetical protein
MKGIDPNACGQKLPFRIPRSALRFWIWEGYLNE